MRLNKLPLAILNTSLVILFIVSGFSMSAFAAETSSTKTMSEEQITVLMKQLDEKTRFNGDYKAVAIAHSQNREKGESIQKMAIYRRDADKRLMILFLQPKSDAGKGYLMIDKNFFSYEPSTGGWTRVSDDRVGGSALNRANFDGFNFSERYKGEFVAYETLGKYEVARLKLTANDSADSDEEVIELWIETENNNVLKQQDYALSGRLLRTTYRTNYKNFTDRKGNSQFVPMKSIVKDEVEVGNQTTMVIEQIDTGALASNIFTKAWLESKSR
jgi:hypothetical protein